MNKFKTFIIGVIVGSLIIGGSSLASEQLRLEVSVPSLSFWIDDEELEIDSDVDVPKALNYEGVNYVPMRFFAESMGYEVEWDGTSNRVLLNASQPVDYQIIEEEPVAAVLQQWVKQSLKYEMSQVRRWNDSLYLLITLGEKTTGGYSVSVVDIKNYENSIHATILIEEPDKGSFVTEGLTYPYILINLGDIEKKPIEVVTEDDEAFSVLMGTGFIHSIYRSTDDMVLYRPEYEEDRIIFQGAARSFEGFVDFVVKNESGDVIHQNIIKAEGSLPNWTYFRHELEWDSSEEINASFIFKAIQDVGIEQEGVYIEFK